MRKKKKREFSASELTHIIAKKYGFEDKLLAFEIKKFLQEKLSQSAFEEIRKVDYQKGTVYLYIDSMLAKNDFRFKTNELLSMLKEKFGQERIDSLVTI